MTRIILLIKQSAIPGSRGVVVGGGFIGAENLVHRGLKVTIVELSEQVMAPLDRELPAQVHHHIRSQMSMNVMGLSADELIDGVEIAGVASYIESAEQSDMNLFISFRPV